MYLSAFADEISADLDEQIDVLLSAGIHHLDLRGVWDTNVLDLTDEQVSQIRTKLDAHGIRVAAIGSPIGKVPIDSPSDETMRRFERAITLAHAFGTPYIRIFSFYPPERASGPVDPSSYRDEVLRRLRAMAERAQAAGVILQHENEKDIYGDTVARCLDLMQELGGKRFQAVLDPANFVYCGETPYPDAYTALRPWIGYVHVKDGRADGPVVPAGEGASSWPAILRALRESGYDGCFSLEPHLASAGRYRGHSGPELFGVAALSFQGLLAAMDWPPDRR
jgi:sugar phosphate isomerase/epimerase